MRSLKSRAIENTSFSFKTADSELFSNLDEASLWHDLPETTQSSLSGGKARFPLDGPGRGGTVTLSRNLIAHELTHVV